MPGGQDEPVPIGPARIRRIELVESGPKRGCHVRHAEGQARVPGSRPFRRVDRQRPYSVRHAAGDRNRPSEDFGLQSQDGIVGRQLGGSGHADSLVRAIGGGGCCGNPFAAAVSFLRSARGTPPSAFGQRPQRGLDAKIPRQRAAREQPRHVPHLPPRRRIGLAIQMRDDPWRCQGGRPQRHALGPD